MVNDYDPHKIARPNAYLITMFIFLIIIGLVTAIFYRQIMSMFYANVALNSLILGVLLLGTLLSFRDLLLLYPEINWVNNYRRGALLPEEGRGPKMLGPMATLLANKDAETSITAQTMRSLLESIGMRLDERRDTARYMIGLLVFLGLLGTFWGLLGTVSAVGDTIQSLDVTSGDTNLIFEDLKTGLEAPLAGMGTAFSSSLFGLSGSLILGFLDLRSGHAQGRFYNDLEDWLSSFAKVDGMPDIRGTPLETDSDMRLGLERITAAVNQAGRESMQTGVQTNTEVANLSTRIETLVHQMRSEQQLVRNWMEAQSDQQTEIREFLATLTRAANMTASQQSSTPPSNTDGDK